MDNNNFIEKLAAQFGQSATVKNVFGEPIQAADKTIIPVVQIAYGCGGGYGQGKNKMPAAKELSGEGRHDFGEGAGGGGGMIARPKGVFEITENSTKFIPACTAKILIAGLVAGFLIKTILFRRRRKMT